MTRAIRVGIDVGGTHTKAVAIDNDTFDIVGIGSVKTTHDDPRGVSAGVIEAFKKCLDDNGIRPEEVTFIAHSTTQATNALLEGDVAKIGVIGMGSSFLAKKQSVIKDIILDETGKRKIETVNSYIPIKKFSDALVIQTIDELTKQGAEVLVASEAFGVDNNHEEVRVAELGRAKNLEVSQASDISKMYGLSKRTRTAVINASILPKMFETADSTENSVREEGIKVPLMIMRGDGGVMDINEMRKRPVLTMLSGPAASTVGALMYLKASNAIFFEVGGTSTDIGVIKNGRPMIDYSVVGGHKTLISSLDVHVSGVAGGSMVRASKSGVIAVGPRSAHIAKLPYAAFSKPEEIIEPKVVLIQPLKDDPTDYVAIEGTDGKRFAVTVTCAANVLGLVKEGDFSFGNYEASYKAVKALADFIGTSAEEAATQILDKASDTVIAVINELAEKYKVERSQISLVGGGGGVAALLPFTAKKMGLGYEIAKHAEVISSIGVALAMVRDVVERVIPNPSPQDLEDIRSEAIQSATKSGANPETIEVQMEIDAQTNKIRAIATGSTEVKTTDLATNVDEAQALSFAAKSMQVSDADVYLIEKNDYFYCFGTRKKEAQELRIVDKKGFIKVQRANGEAVCTSISGVRNIIDKYWEELSVYKSDIKLAPDIYLCIGAKVVDYTGMLELSQLHMVMDTELQQYGGREEVIVVGARNNL
ncbi:MAG: hydantoinase/oxoprolinase family protein [Streptococcaceae bacterium]|jgi:N-methylhydantoinase A/oxoprolinase/acetone carboxylase beta subunit|nr:hydantoinase/oxoprolinase family protein [Streptococcaceae bacterium]